MSLERDLLPVFSFLVVDYITRRSLGPCNVTSVNDGWIGVDR
jgi:hypothetical protein